MGKKKKRKNGNGNGAVKAKTGRNTRGINNLRNVNIVPEFWT